MNETDILTLLLINSGDYHALRCARVENGFSVEDLEQGKQRLLTHDLVEIIGDEILVSDCGRQIIDTMTTDL